MKQGGHPDALAQHFTLQGKLTTDDLRTLTPLKWQHNNPYGTFTLNMTQRLPLEGVF